MKGGSEPPAPSSLAFKYKVPNQNYYFVGWADNETIVMLGTSGYFFHVAESGLVRQDAASGSWATQGAAINSALSVIGWGPYDVASVEPRFVRGENIPSFELFTSI